MPIGRLDKPLDRITEADIRALVADHVSEQRMIEYKRALPTNDDGKRKFARQVASFSNTDGGDILFGVEEATSGSKRLGYPGDAPGLAAFDLDATKLKLQQIAQDLIHPRIPPLDFGIVEGFDAGPVLIVRIAKSWSAPHMFGAPNDSPFLARHAAGKYPLDVTGIRDAFLADYRRAERFARLHADRRTDIADGRAPVQIGSFERGAIILHAIPITPIHNFDLHAIVDANLVRLESGSNPRFNAHGYIAADDGGGEMNAMEYAQLFRDGVFESVAQPLAFPERDGRRFLIHPNELEHRIVERATAYLRIVERQYRGPIAIFGSFIGATGLVVDAHRLRTPTPLTTHTLTLPDVTIEQSARPVPLQLRPMLDAIWQAGGVGRSPHFNDRDEWADPTKR